jgi:hypothetical protein
VPGMTPETVVILNAKNVAIGSQTYDWHEHYLGGECDGEGCDPLTEPHDYTYHEEIKGNATRDNDEVLLHIKPDGSYSVEAFFNSPLMAGTYTANPGCSGGVSVPGNQIKVKIEGFGLPNPTSLVGKLPASTTDITVYSRHGSASDITLTEDVAVEWNFTLAK